MQLVPLQVLTPVVASGVALWGVGATLPEGRGDGVRRTGFVVALLAVVATAVWGLFLLMGTLMEQSPEAAPLVLVGLIAALAVLPFLIASRPGPKKRDVGSREDEGGGGTRKPEPAPRPTPPAPAAPEPVLGPSPWDDFDAIRSGWERVPAGTR